MNSDYVEVVKKNGKTVVCANRSVHLESTTFKHANLNHSVQAQSSEEFPRFRKALA